MESLLTTLNVASGSAATLKMLASFITFAGEEETRTRGCAVGLRG
jgi:hypothetical protein